MPVGLGSMLSVTTTQNGSAPTDKASISATLAVNFPTTYPVTLILSMGLGPMAPAESQLTTRIRFLSSLKRRISRSVSIWAIVKAVKAAAVLLTPRRWPQPPLR